MFARASLYFVACSSKNRLRKLLEKLKSPRYLIGLSVTVLYFWFVFFAIPFFEGMGGPVTARRGANTGLVLGGFYLLQVVVMWFSLSSGRGVAFRESEIQQLLPRPFTRWQVLLLKWMASQFPVLIGAFLVGLVFLRFGEFHYPFVVGGFLLSSSALYANATLVGLWLARLKHGKGVGAFWLQLPAWSLLVLLIVCALLAWHYVGGVETWDQARAMLDAPTLRAFAWPFTALAGPLAATDAQDFWLSSIYPLSLILVQGFLVWWIDFRFEDQAVDIAAKIQKLGKEGMSALASKESKVVERPESPWGLAPTGPAWRALTWKNVISIGRFPRRALIRVLLVMIVVGIVFTGIFDRGSLETKIGYIILILAFYASLLAPSFVRVDLRIDIPHFDVLKAMPIRGRSLIFGEIMGTVMVMWVVQMVATVVAAVLITVEGDFVFSVTDRVAGVVALGCAFFALDFTMVTSENLLALWMPGYVRLGRGLRPGLDQMGQNLIGALVRMLVLMGLFLIPVTAGIFVGALLFAATESIAASFLPAFAIGAALLALEAWLLIVISEGRYDRFDITSEKITEEE